MKTRMFSSSRSDKNELTFLFQNSINWSPQHLQMFTDFQHTAGNLDNNFFFIIMIPFIIFNILCFLCSIVNKIWVGGLQNIALFLLNNFFAFGVNVSVKSLGRTLQSVLKLQNLVDEPGLLFQLRLVLQVPCRCGAAQSETDVRLNLDLRC